LEEVWGCIIGRGQFNLHCVITMEEKKNSQGKNLTQQRTRGKRVSLPNLQSETQKSEHANGKTVRLVLGENGGDKKKEERKRHHESFLEHKGVRGNTGVWYHVATALIDASIKKSKS